MLIFIGICFLPDIGFAAEKLSRTILKVSGFCCKNCLTYVDSRLQTISEVKGMISNPEKKTITVDHDRSLKGEKIASFFNKLGYPAEVLTETAIDEKDSLVNAGAGRCTSSCCGIGSGSYKRCGATSASWKRLFKILKGDGNDS